MKRLIFIGLLVAAAIWLISDVNVNATITAGDPTVTYRGA